MKQLYTAGNNTYQLDADGKIGKLVTTTPGQYVQVIRPATKVKAAVKGPHAFSGDCADSGCEACLAKVRHHDEEERVWGCEAAPPTYDKPSAKPTTDGIPPAPKTY